MTYMREESKKEWVYVCITDSLCCTAESNTTLWINCTLIKILKSNKGQKTNKQQPPPPKKKSQKETDCSVKRRKQWHPTPVLLPGKSHGWRSLVGCSPWGLSRTRLMRLSSSSSSVKSDKTWSKPRFIPQLAAQDFSLSDACFHSVLLSLLLLPLGAWAGFPAVPPSSPSLGISPGSVNFPYIIN